MDEVNSHLTLGQPLLLKKHIHLRCHEDNWIFVNSYYNVKSGSFPKDYI